MNGNFNDILINGATGFPLLAAALMLCFQKFIGDKSALIMGLAATAFSCFAGVWAWICFWIESSAADSWAFVSISTCNFLPNFGLNGVSAPLFALAGIVGFAAFIWAAQSQIENKKLYMALLLLMHGGLMGVFSATNVLWIYMFHEFALIPTFIAMCVWGGAGKRMAAMQMAVYLTLGALLVLLGIVALRVQSGADSFSIFAIATAVSKVGIVAAVQKWIFALMLFGLGTLVSLFPFHSWAPRTYAAAPTSFAMLHAGVLKKFGLYLLIQFAIPILPVGARDWTLVLVALALCNVIYIGLVAMAQNDLKMMVSYSSVSHMGMCFLGVAAMSVTGVGGAVLLMFGHGLSAALLFMLSNAVVNKTGEWDMRKMGGLYKKTPVLAAFFLLAVFASLGLPGFANFFGELSIFVSLWSYSPAVCALAATGLVISSVYCLRAFASIFMGETYPATAATCGEISDINWKQRIPAILLAASLIFAGVCPRSVTDGLNSCLSNMAVYAQTK